MSPMQLDAMQQAIAHTRQMQEANDDSLLHPKTRNVSFGDVTTQVDGAPQSGNVTQSDEPQTKTNPDKQRMGHQHSL